MRTISPLFRCLFVCAVWGFCSTAGSPAAGAAQKLPNGVKVPDDVIWQPDVEYSNPGGESLKLDLARPKTGEGPFPAVLVYSRWRLSCG